MRKGLKFIHTGGEIIYSLFIINYSVATYSLYSLYGVEVRGKFLRSLLYYAVDDRIFFQQS